MTPRPVRSKPFNKPSSICLSKYWLADRYHQHISISRKLIRNAKSQGPSQINWIVISILTRLLSDSHAHSSSGSTALIDPQKNGWDDSNVVDAPRGCALWWPWACHVSRWKDSVMWSYQFSPNKLVNFIKRQLKSKKRKYRCYHMTWSSMGVDNFAYFICCSIHSLFTLTCAKWWANLCGLM